MNTLTDEQCDAIRDDVRERFDDLTPNIQRTRTFQFMLIRAGAAAVPAAVPDAYVARAGIGGAEDRAGHD
jgi:hypothetical protein